MCTFISVNIFYLISFSFITVVVADHYMWGSVKLKDTSAVETFRVKELESVSSVQYAGNALILTPYIEKGNNKQGRSLSQVRPEMGGWPSYSGYFTVNKKCGSNIFFWFIPAKIDWKEAPVLLWLQGGPGAGSLYGLFQEIGPFNHVPSGLKRRNLTWNTENNIIYIDNPVGSGFSFSKNKCYAENMTTVAEELYSALTQFFQLFPELRKNKFFLTGESFAGHYIPALGLYIHQKNYISKTKINLAGILIGNPLTNLSCHDYSTFLYEWGFVGEDLRNQIKERHKMLKTHAGAGQYKEAWKDWDYILNNLILEKSHLPNRECMINYPLEQSDYVSWLSTPAVRKQLHVGLTKYLDFNLEVYNKLINTIAEPMTSGIEKLLEAKIYSVGFYSGNLDMICLTTSTECLLNGLQWWGREAYFQAQRIPFTIDEDSLAGWVKYAGPLYLVVIRDSGHSVPAYQPNVTLTLIDKVTKAASGVNPGSLFDKYQ